MYSDGRRADDITLVDSRDPASFRVDFRSPAGRWTLGAPLAVNRVKIDARERAAYIERNAASYKPAVPPNPFPVQRVPTAGDFPEFIPPFANGSAMAGPDGLLIVRRSKSADYMQAHYLFIDRQGRLVGELTLPVTEEIVGAGPRTLYLSVKDEDDILHIRRHPW